ncbi:MAG: type II toxin-antitoxin system VapB family antitoxin [Proteobacteria bacterium]|nr:type II toxin-antitoxin system VapB family antitoxin [Pseudomonadota bacterium]
MRTTIRIDDELLKEAKHQATKTGTTLTAIIEESLREKFLRSKQSRQKRKKVKLMTSGDGGLQPGVNIDDSSALLDLIEKTE